MAFGGEVRAVALGGNEILRRCNFEILPVEAGLIDAIDAIFGAARVRDGRIDGSTTSLDPGISLGGER